MARISTTQIKASHLFEARVPFLLSPPTPRHRSRLSPMSSAAISFLLVHRAVPSSRSPSREGALTFLVVARRSDQTSSSVLCDTISPCCDWRRRFWQRTATFCFERIGQPNSRPRTMGAYSPCSHYVERIGRRRAVLKAQPTHVSEVSEYEVTFQVIALLNEGIRELLARVVALYVPSVRPVPRSNHPRLSDNLFEEAHCAMRQVKWSHHSTAALLSSSFSSSDSNQGPTIDTLWTFSYN